ncbi:hypothetical protein PICMEDRAFT_15949 [Pichia membranifaciens NRRL Y-2026]|uniref:Uncharacterized protein n=1 Tax=Pichia membranifaciens NRRL Y-2026 TaxID=763406 RepID=A0A1E3NQ02_9ASCO|nr:hypothetical protein PICMEDRAFT_15949 [Pichia membranifaciens NRRL Y-2026]ODQ48116.1 hypothetical protein PICMEDRAFT_15949 [Pichia membranifaciens NRRL Y-2026]
MQRTGMLDAGSKETVDPMDLTSDYDNYTYDTSVSSLDYSKMLKGRNAFRLKGGFQKVKSFIQEHKFVRYVLFLIPLFVFAYLITYPSHKDNSPSKIVMILAVNEGGGVERWKTPQEWSVERSSIANKKAYAQRHGYTLTLKDTSLKRRYSHEWREGWEKVDILRQTMREYPDAEWFWWLDTYTFIMEPELSLESYLLEDINKKAYRSVEHFNPLGIKTDVPYVNTLDQPIDMILAQDCGGFNLGSFLIRRSEWTDLLLDAWWDPVLYEQMHMVWEHKEQDCLEVLYSQQPWIRERLGFVPLKAINSFPDGACEDQKDDKRYFYSKKDRDFIVNMAGCNFGDRSCWDEYENFRNLKAELHRPWYKLW